MTMRTITTVVASVIVLIGAIFLRSWTDTWCNGGLVPFFKSIFVASPVSIAGATVHDPSRNLTYAGISHGSVEQYLGIFYAADTSGGNRFAPPKPLILAQGSIIDATKAGAWCPQGTGGPPLPFTSLVEDISENCLSLGITRPSRIKLDASLPVLVWIHGGGHALGSYADQLYEPSGLVEQSAADGSPIIFVGINYRLGIFGFARSKALTEAGHTNVGLRDQRAAYEWVRQNIAHFGGDPDNIISIGQSVGASDTGLHITSYGGKRGVPFHKAIMMSGAPGLTFNVQSDLVANNTASVAHALGCATDETSQSQKTLQCLRDAPMERLVNLSVTASRLARPPFGEGFFYPTQDEDYIPDRPSELLRRGEFVKDVPTIASWVTNDGAWYAPPLTASDEEVTGSYGLWLFGLSERTHAKLLQLYPIKDFEVLAQSATMGGLSPQYYRAAQINRDVWFTCPVLDFAHHHALHSTDRASPSIYLYEHNATRFTPVFQNIMQVPFWGVSHLSDIPYVLNNDVAAGGDNSVTAKHLARSMSRMIVKFAYTGQPGAGWPNAFSLKSPPSEKGELPSPMKLMYFQHQTNGAESGVVEATRSSLEQQPDKADARERGVEWEKLFERCDFINSAQVRKEIDV